MLPEMRIQAAVISHNSPYAAVRAVTETVDDTEIVCSTIRSWAIGLVFCAAVVFCNVFFNIRFPSIAVSTSVAQLLAYPLGMLMASVLPDWGVTVFGVRHSLNPGPFTKKEHMLATIIAQSSPTEPYSYYIIWIQVLPFMYNQPWARNFGYQVCLTLSTSMLGYGLSGILRSLVVEPAFCVFPTVLATVGLNKAFHMKQNEEHAVDGPTRTRWTATRLRLFLYAAAAMFVYFWLPNYLFPALSMFSWMTWIAPDNKTLSFITGVQSGLGLNPVPTFDWNVVTSITPPLELPFWVTANQFLGFLVSAIFVAAMYLTNYQYTGYLPLNSSQMFDRFGERYNMTKILDSKGSLDVEAYRAYSPPYQSLGVIVSYAGAFALTSGVIAQVLLFHRNHVAAGFKRAWANVRNRSTQEQESTENIDVHMRLMKAYKAVPAWWYLICFTIALVLSLVSILCWPTNATPAAPFFGLIVAAVIMIPEAIVFAVTGVNAATSLVSEFIAGSLTSGNAISMIFLKTFGANVSHEAVQFAVTQKIGHYTKLPPRTVFCAQIIGTLVSSFIALGVLSFQMSIEGVCTPEAPYRFFCRNIQVFQNTAVIWGNLGPQRLFGSGGLYSPSLSAFAVGPALVLVYWALRKKFPKSKTLHYFSPAAFIFGSTNWIYTSLSFMWPAFVVGAFSWLHVRRRYLAFWTKVTRLFLLQWNGCQLTLLTVQLYAIGSTEHRRCRICHCPVLCCPVPCEAPGVVGDGHYRRGMRRLRRMPMV